MSDTPIEDAPTDEVAAPPAPAAAPVPDTPWRALEPLSLVVNLVPDMWRTVRSAWPLLLAVLVGGGVANLVNLGFLGVFLLMGTARTVIHFLTLRYRLHAGKLEIRSGLIGRSFRVIDPARIQNIEVVQNIFHKATGLVELRIETAGDAGAEGLLSALSVAEATSLRDRLANVAHVEAPAADHALHDITLAELVGYGVSAGRVGAVVLAFGVGMEILGQVSPQEMARGINSMRPGAALGVGLLALAGGYTLSVGNAILRHYGFKLFRSPRGLRFEAGLFTRRGVEMAYSKVQLVRMEEPWMRRLMGYGTLVVETAASGAPGEQASPEGSIPMVPVDDHARLVLLVLPTVDVNPWAQPLLPPARQALIRGVVAGGIRWTFLAFIIGYWVGYPAIVLPLVGVVVAWLEWKRQGWLVTPGTIVARTGFFSQRTWIVPREKIQSVHLTSDPLLRRYNLARVMVWVAGSAVRLPALALPDAERVFRDLTQKRPLAVTAPPIEGAG